MMADGYKVATLDEMSHPEWGHWKTVRHSLGIRAFGINAWTKGVGEDVILSHDESASGHEELYLVVNGRATFTVGGEELDAPAGTAVFVSDPSLERSATAREDETTVLSIGGWADRPFEVSAWEQENLADQ
jgi:hypothetical protein